MEDADANQVLIWEAFAKWVGLTGREPLPMRVDYADGVRKHRSDLVYVDSRLVALIETVPKISSEREFRGASSLLGLWLRSAAHEVRLEEELAASQLAGMRLYPNKLFSQNIRLYETLGTDWRGSRRSTAGLRSTW